MKERTRGLLLAVATLVFAADLLLRAVAAVQPARSEIVAPAALRARSIELVDDHGQVRASLLVEPDGEAVFRMRDGKARVLTP